MTALSTIEGGLGQLFQLVLSDGTTVTAEIVPVGGGSSPNTAAVVNAASEPAQSITFSANPLILQGSGLFLVQASMSGSASGADVVKLELQDNGVTFGPSVMRCPTSSPLGSPLWQGSVSWLFVVGDTNPHTFACKATALNGALLTTPPGSCEITIFEVA